MKKSIIKKLVILLLFSINAISFEEKLNRCALPLNTVYSLASENNPGTIKIQSATIGYFSVSVTSVNSINERSILQSVKEIEVFTAT